MAKAKAKAAPVEKTVADLDQLLTNMHKEYGKESIRLGGDFDPIARWSLSSPLISYILGSGTPKGRIIELYGPESAGKTSLACYIAGEIQMAGGRVAYIDAENGADLEYAETLGLDRESLLFSQPDSGEQALNMVHDMVSSGLLDFIIIDSVSALTPQAEIDGDMGDQQMGLQARLMSKAMRKLNGICNKTETTLLFINQIRHKIGVMFGNPETTSGGNALKFYSSVRLEIRKVEFLVKGSDEPYGVRTRIKSVKNKTAPPYRKGEIDIIFGKGIQYRKEYVDFAVTHGIIDKSGSWYSYKEDRLGQGKDNVVQHLTENVDIYLEIKDKVDAILYPKRKELPKRPPKEEVTKDKKTEAKKSDENLTKK